MFVPISFTKTKRWTSNPSATSVRQAALSPSSRSLAPAVLFSAPAEALEQPRDRRLAHPHPKDSLQELTPLGEGRRRAPLEVSFQESPATLVDPLGACRVLSPASVDTPRVPTAHSA